MDCLYSAFDSQPAQVRMAERSKAPDLSSGSRKGAWVRTPLLTSSFCCFATQPVHDTHRACSVLRAEPRVFTMQPRNVTSCFLPHSGTMTHTHHALRSVTQRYVVLRISVTLNGLANWPGEQGWTSFSSTWTFETFDNNNYF